LGGKPNFNFRGVQKFLFFFFFYPPPPNKENSKNWNFFYFWGEINSPQKKRGFFFIGKIGVKSGIRGEGLFLKNFLGPPQGILAPLNFFLGGDFVDWGLKTFF